MSTISNKTITRTVTLGTVNSYPTYASPLTITSSGDIDVPPYGNGIYGGLSGGPLSIVNYGTISGSLSGISLAGVGFITNAAGLIQGKNGLALEGTSTTVQNSATIVGTSYSGVVLASGVVTNTAGLIAGKVDGIEAVGAVTVTNSSTIRSTGTNQLNAGIYLLAGGAITNTVSGLIAGQVGILSHVYGGAVSNAGTILGGIEFSNPNSSSISNAGMIEGLFGVGISGNGSVHNTGTIIGTLAAGVYINFQGYVDNVQTTSLISGYSYGVSIIGTAGTVVNHGTILTSPFSGASLISDGIRLNSGGLVVNSGTVIVTGSRGEGVVSNYRGTIGNTVTNSGTITATYNGINLNGGGMVNNLGNGLIQGQYGIHIDGLAAGTIFNTGRIVGVAGNAVYLSSRGTIINSGTIFNTGTGAAALFLKAGGIVSNTGTITRLGTIGAYQSINIEGGAGTVSNSGVIAGGNTGVRLADGGSVSNLAGGSISPGVIVAGGAGIVSNAGTISAAPFLVGVYLLAGGSVTNSAGALISGGTGLYINGGYGTAILAGTIIGSNPIGWGVGLARGGTITDSATISGGSGTAIIFGGTGTNLLALQPGYAISGKVAGSGSPGASNTLELAGSTGAGLTVSYNSLTLTNFQDVLFGSGGYDTLKISNTSGTLPVRVSGLTLNSDAIDLTVIGTNGTITRNDPSNHLLTVSGSVGAVTLQLDSSDATSFATASDGASGTELTPVCFCRGTLILTEEGEIPVEALAVGDRVKTLTSGAFKPIVWIGFGRDLVTRGNKLARPIIVRRGALNDNVPHRDLYLTHGHALYFEGALIPVEHLVNHTTIAWDETARVVEYYHIELDDHDVVFAEGAAAETYYEARNRARFHNTRMGSEARGEKPTCAPVLHDGDLVGRIWAELNIRAGAKTATDTTDDPHLHLSVDGLRIDAISCIDSIYTFTLLQPPKGPLLLRSRSAVPSLLGDSRHEHRQLGVALRQVIVQGQGVMIALDYDAALFRHGGCYAPENGFCWTDGELALPSELFASLRGAVTVIVHTVRQEIRYPIKARAHRLSA